jgi:hypothetical protein
MLYAIYYEHTTYDDSIFRQWLAIDVLVIRGY